MQPLPERLFSLAQYGIQMRIFSLFSMNHIDGSLTQVRLFVKPFLNFQKKSVNEHIELSFYPHHRYSLNIHGIKISERKPVSYLIHQQ